MENYKIEYKEEEIEAINATLLKGCTEYEKLQVWHLADKYGLDLMQKGQLWISGFGNQRNIIVGRDGQLSIAHRKGGIRYFKSGAIWRKDDELHELDPLGAYCVIERMDGAHFEVEVNFREYNKKQALWKTMPAEMISKCAEVKCLKRAFDMTGFYSPEEFEEVKAEAAATRNESIEELEKADAAKGDALFTSRKEREAVKQPEPAKEVPAKEEPVKEAPKEVPKVETPKAEPAEKVEQKDDEQLSSADPKNVADFEIFKERMFEMFGERVQPDEERGILGTPGNYEQKKDALRKSYIQRAKDAGRM